MYETVASGKMYSFRNADIDAPILERRAFRLTTSLKRRNLQFVSPWISSDSEAGGQKIDEKEKTFGVRKKRSEKERSHATQRRALATPNNYSHLVELLRTVRWTAPWTSSSYQESIGRRLERREIEERAGTREKKSRGRGEGEWGWENSLDETCVYTQDERILIAEVDGTHNEPLRRKLGKDSKRYWV